MPLWTAGAVLVGGMMSADATSSAADSQYRADMARLEEEKRVRAKWEEDMKVQRAKADQLFADAAAGKITYAQAQEGAANIYRQAQDTVAAGRLNDVQKTQDMTQFTPYSIRTGSGSSFYDQSTGQAGYNLSPELQQLQNQGYGGANTMLSSATAGMSPEMQQYRDTMYGKANTMAGNLATSPEEAAKTYYQQQMNLLQPGRAAEDINLRQQQLNSGRLGLGISSEAAGAGEGGMVNPEQWMKERAREQVNADVAMKATQAGMDQASWQLGQSKGMFGEGGAATNQYQTARGNDINAASNMYNIGSGVEDMVRHNMAMGMDFGTATHSANVKNADLYNQGMSNYYNDTLSSAATGREAALYVPGATSGNLNDAYAREQGYFNTLSGQYNPYTPMSTPTPGMSGSDYFNANVGNTLLNYGMNRLTSGWNNVSPTNTYTPSGGTMPAANYSLSSGGAGYGIRYP